VEPEVQQALRQRAQHFNAYYATIYGPNRPEDRTLFHPSSAQEVPKGMPLTDFQKERIIGTVALMSEPNPGAVRKTCWEIDVKDGATIQELVRRHTVLLSTGHQRERAGMNKSFAIGFDTPENAAFTVACYEELVPRPVPWELQSYLRVELQKAAHAGVVIDDVCPGLTKALHMEKPRRDAQAYLMQPSVDVDGRFDDLLFKGAKPPAGEHLLGPKLLKPYLTCRIHEEVNWKLRQYMNDQTRFAKSNGYSNDYAPVQPMDTSRHAELVWASLVERATGDHADPNLVAALNMTGRAWVVRKAQTEFDQYMDHIRPTVGGHEVSASY
jgi:hypothetical protein